MTAFDFDTPVDRRGSGSLKWDVPAGELPMWVADMDFKTAPAVRDALAGRLAHGVFGYSVVPDEWYSAYCDWWRERHGVTFDPAWLTFATGVVPALSSIVRKLTTVGENVLIMTPVYNIFFNSIVNNGRHVLESPLRYEGGVYDIDFADLERKLADPETSMLILCNPHNPVGKIWSRETLARIGVLAKKHHVLVVSDEIHCDLTDPGCAYTPFASVSDDCRENSVTLIAPTKAFNLAGLQTACTVTPDPTLRHRVSRGLNTDEVAEPNAFAVTAAVAAFTKGAPWLDALRTYLYENKCLVRETLARECPDLRVTPSDATYLLWLDVSRIVPDADRLADHLRRAAGLYLTAGSEYGESGRAFLRMNVAAPRATVEEGLRRLTRGLASFRDSGD